MRRAIPIHSFQKRIFLISQKCKSLQKNRYLALFKSIKNYKKKLFGITYKNCMFSYYKFNQYNLSL